MENQAKMSHRIIRITLYGTKSTKIQDKLSHRTPIKGHLGRKPYGSINYFPFAGRFPPGLLTGWPPPSFYVH